jgi:hypothetical protein
MKGRIEHVANTIEIDKDKLASLLSYINNENELTEKELGLGNGKLKLHFACRI